MAMPVRVAVLSDDCRLLEAWAHAVDGDLSYVALKLGKGVGLRLTLRSSHPDFVVIDYRLPGAISVCADVAHSGGPRVIVVNVPADDESAVDVLSAGARGVVYAAAPPGEVVKALHAVATNQVWAPRHVIVAMWMRMHTEHERRVPPEAALAQRLSTREREVFRYAAAGLGNKELASRLAISEATVKVHLTHIFQKLGLRGRAELAAAYHGILR